VDTPQVAPMIVSRLAFIAAQLIRIILAHLYNAY